MQKKAYLIWVLVIALVLSSWTVTSAMGTVAPFKPDQNSNDCRSGSSMLVGNLAAQRVAINRAGQLCDFDVRLNQVNSKVSGLDKRFIAASIAADQLEIQSLNFALGQAQNAEWRGLIQMMIAQHTADLDMAMKVAKKIGLNTNNIDLKNMRVYPGTPEYELGVRRVNLVAKFLDPLMSAGGTAMTPTATGVPTDNMTGTPTGTDMTPSATGTTDLTGTATETMDTAIPLPSATGTVDLTGTATGTMDTTTPSATGTGDMTGTPSATSTVDLTGTASASPTAMDTSTPTAVPTLVTPIPTIPGGATANFDLVSMMIIADEHVMIIETALAAERLVQNDEIRAFARHAADMAQLHLILLNDIKYRMMGLTILPPPPQFQKDFEGPRRFGPDAIDANDNGND